MVAIRASSNIREFVAGLNDIGRKQLPFATARALTFTARTVRNNQRGEMQRAFDRPTPFTLNSVFYTPATKQNLVADVHFKDFAPKGTPAGKYLQPQVLGGARRPKRVEVLLRARGILGANEFIVPAQGGPNSQAYPLDSYGNLPRSLWNKILSQLGAQADVAQRETQRTRKRRVSRRAATYFVGGGEINRPGVGFGIASSLPRGIYERTGGSMGEIRGVVMFVREPRYQVAYPFFDIVNRQADEIFPQEFDRSIAKAIETRRR